jgi:hypothetical protein
MRLRRGAPREEIILPQGTRGGLRPPPCICTRNALTTRGIALIRRPFRRNIFVCKHACKTSSAASGRVDLQFRAPYLGAGLEGNCQLHGNHNGSTAVAHELRRVLPNDKSCAGATPSHTAATYQTNVSLHGKFQTFILISLEFGTFISTQVEV